MPRLIFIPAFIAGALGLALAHPAVGQLRGLAPEIRLRADFAPNPLELAGTSGGSLPVANVIAQTQTPTGPCLGYISANPSHILTLDDFFDGLAVAIESDQDTTLVIQGPGGVWCNDDADGHNPRIAGQWQAGSYRIWVGSYGQGESYPYQMILRRDPLSPPS